MKTTITKKLNRFSIMVIVISLLALLGLGGITYAVYTAVNNAKRVIYTQGGSDECFSSNYMTLAAKSATGVPGYSKISYPASVSNPTIVVSVCNYPQGNMTLWCEDFIYYSFEAVLVDSANAPVTPTTQFTINEETVSFTDYLSYYKVDGEAFTWDSTTSSYKVTITDKSLSPAQTNRNTHKISIAKALIDSGVSIWTSAVTTNDSSYSDYNLSGIIRTEYAVAASDTEWSMSIVEEETITAPNVYGFNVLLSGSAIRTVTFGYDSSKLIINPRFLDDLGADNYTETAEGDFVYYEFQVGGIQSSYTVQFFYKDLSIVDSWDTVKSWIVFPEKETE